MKTWIIASMLVGLLMVGGITLVNAISDNSDTVESSLDVVETISCSSCGNSCTAESNCGLETCGIVSGEGSCRCGK